MPDQVRHDGVRLSNCQVNMILSFHSCFDTDIQIILGDRPLSSGDLELIRKAKAIILPQACSKGLYDACTKSNALIFPGYEVRFKYQEKTGQSVLFKCFGCPHPETQIWSSVEKFKKGHKYPHLFPHEAPFLVKADKAHESEGVYLVTDETSMSEALDHMTNREKSGISGFVTQAHIESGGNVLRAVIIGRNIITYWKRPCKSGDAITSISRDAIIDHNWKPDLQKKGRIQAQSLSKKTGINLAAVDFVFPLSEKEPEPLFLEINYYFGRRGLGGTGRYYHLLHEAIQDWLSEVNLDTKSIRLV